MSPNLIVVFFCMVVASILTSICHYGRKRFQRGRHVNGGLARDMEAENIDGPEHHRPHAFRSYIVQHEAPGYTGRVRIWRQLPDRNALELSTITDNPEAELQQFFRTRMEFAQEEIFGRDFSSHRAVTSTPPPMPNVPPPRQESAPLTETRPRRVIALRQANQLRGKFCPSDEIIRLLEQYPAIWYDSDLRVVGVFGLQQTFPWESTSSDFIRGLAGADLFPINPISTPKAVGTHGRRMIYRRG